MPRRRRAERAAAGTVQPASGLARWGERGDAPHGPGEGRRAPYARADHACQGRIPQGCRRRPAARRLARKPRPSGVSLSRPATRGAPQHAARREPVGGALGEKLRPRGPDARPHKAPGRNGGDAGCRPQARLRPRSPDAGPQEAPGRNGAEAALLRTVQPADRGPGLQELPQRVEAAVGVKLGAPRRTAARRRGQRRRPGPGRRRRSGAAGQRTHRSQASHRRTWRTRSRQPRLKPSSRARGRGDTQRARHTPVCEKAGADASRRLRQKKSAELCTYGGTGTRACYSVFPRR